MRFWSINDQRVVTRYRRPRMKQPSRSGRNRQFLAETILSPSIASRTHAATHAPALAAAQPRRVDPVCGGLLVDTFGSGAEWVRESYGPDSPGRRILLAVYLSIGLVSAGLLVWRQPTGIAALLAVQIVYKLLTPLTVGTLQNPVVISNLLIAAFHAATLVVCWRAGFYKPQA